MTPTDWQARAMDANVEALLQLDPYIREPVAWLKARAETAERALVESIRTLEIKEGAIDIASGELALAFKVQDELRARIVELSTIEHRVKCRLCDDFAVAIWAFDEGCVCAEDKVQALCPQHGVKAEPIGSKQLLFYIPTAEKLAEVTAQLECVTADLENMMGQHLDAEKEVDELQERLEAATGEAAVLLKFLNDFDSDTRNAGPVTGLQFMDMWADYAERWPFDATPLAAAHRARVKRLEENQRTPGFVERCPESATCGMTPDMLEEGMVCHRQLIGADCPIRRAREAVEQST